MESERGSLNNRLSGFGKEPRPEILAEIQQKLAGRRKRVPFWFFLTPVVFFLGITVGYFIHDVKEQGAEELVNNKVETSRSLPETPDNQTEKGGQTTTLKNQNQTPSSIEDGHPSHNDVEPSTETQNENAIVNNELDNNNRKSNLTNKKLSKSLLAASLGTSNYKSTGRELKESRGRKEQINEKQTDVAVANKSGQTTKNQTPASLTETGINDAARNEIVSAPSQKDKKQENENPDKSGEGLKVNTANQKTDSGQDIVNSVGSENLLSKSTAIPVEEKKPIEQETKSTSNDENNSLGHNKVTNKDKISQADTLKGLVASIDSLFKLDTTKKVKHQRLHFSVLVSGRYSAVRYYAINQEKSEMRNSGTNRNDKFPSGTNLEMIGRLHIRMSKVLGMYCQFGAGYSREDLNLKASSTVKDQFETKVIGNTIVKTPVGLIQEERITAEMAYVSSSVGFGFHFAPYLPVMRLGAGMQVGIWSRLTKALDNAQVYSGKMQGTQNGIAFLQASAGKEFPVGKKGKFLIEPVVQYFTRPTLTMKSGTTISTLQAGLQLGWKW
jgi:hypothetical protein